MIKFGVRSTVRGGTGIGNALTWVYTAMLPQSKLHQGLDTGTTYEHDDRFERTIRPRHVHEV